MLTNIIILVSKAINNIRISIPRGVPLNIIVFDISFLYQKFRSTWGLPLVFFSKEEPKGKPHLCKEMNPEPQKKKKIIIWILNLLIFWLSAFPVCHQHKASNPFSLSHPFPHSSMPAEKNKRKIQRNKRRRIPILFLYTPTRASSFPAQCAHYVNQGLRSWLFFKVQQSFTVLTEEIEVILYKKKKRKKSRALFILQSW